MKAADLIVLVGGRLGEQPSQGYTLLDIPAPRQTARARLSRTWRSWAASTARSLAINATPTAFAAALEAMQPPAEIALAQ